MTDKKEWQEANRELMAHGRQTLGDPPTAEEMLAYSRGELSESEEERIRDLLVAYPELARMYGQAFPEEPRPGDVDYVSEEQVAAKWNALQQRLATPQEDVHRGRILFFRYLPTSIAAALALVFFGLFVQAELRARHYAELAMLPRLLGAAQELQPDGRRGPDAPTILRKDGEVYLLEPHLINQVRYPHYRIELHAANDAVIWTNNTAQPEDDAFQIVVPHALLRDGETYQLRIFGIDGESETSIGKYDVRAAAE